MLVTLHVNALWIVKEIERNSVSHVPYPFKLQEKLDKIKLESTHQ